MGPPRRIRAVSLALVPPRALRCPVSVTPLPGTVLQPRKPIIVPRQPVRSDARVRPRRQDGHRHTTTQAGNSCATTTRRCNAVCGPAGAGGARRAGTGGAMNTGVRRTPRRLDDARIQAVVAACFASHHPRHRADRQHSTRLRARPVGTAVAPRPQPTRPSEYGAQRAAEAPTLVDSTSRQPSRRESAPTSSPVPMRDDRGGLCQRRACAHRSSLLALQGRLHNWTLLAGESRRSITIV